MDALIDIAKGVGIAGAFVAIMLLILANVMTQIDATNPEYNASNASSFDEAHNATQDTIDAVGDIPGWLAIVVVVGIAVVLFVLLGRMSNAGAGM